MAEEYYQHLEIPQSASQEEVQKAYRRLAGKYHPDLHADKSDREKDLSKQKFQKIQRAYDVLNDSEKREMYDRFGENFDSPGGTRGGNPFGGGPQFENMDIDLSQIFGGPGGPGPNAKGKRGGGFENLFRQFGGMRGGPGPDSGKGRDVEQEITIAFHTSIVGGEHQVSLQRRDGKVETIKIKIPAGIEDKKKIRLRGQGEMGVPGGPRGDLMIKVRVASHPDYSRTGMNLHVTVPITLIEALFGAKIDIPTPGGTVTVTVPKRTPDGMTLRLKGLGIKSRDRIGDLMVNLQIQIPDSISTEDEELINRLSEKWNDPKIRDGLSW